MAAIAFRSATNNISGGSGLTVNKPAGVVDKDVLLLYASSYWGAEFAAPAGWQVLDANTRIQAWYKVADSEPSSYTLTLVSGTSSLSAIVLVAYTEVATLPIRAHAANLGSGTTSQAPPTLPGLTADNMVVLAYGSSDGFGRTVSDPAGGWTFRSGVSLSESGADRNMKLFVYDKLGGLDTPTVASDLSSSWGISSVALATPGSGNFLSFFM